MRTIVLDSGAFVAAERFDSRVFNVLEIAERNDNPILIDALVIAEIWRSPPGANAVKLAKTGDIVGLTDTRARAVGVLLARTSSTQLADAGVAILASNNKPATVLTSDPNDIATLLRALHCTISLGSPKPGVDVIIESI